MNHVHSSDLIGQREQRISKVNSLIDKGFVPYPTKSSRNITNKEILDDFDKYESKEVISAGRIMSWRKHGEINFIDLQDDSGRIQIYIKLAELSPSDSQKGILGNEDLDLLDIGDHIEVSGVVTKTQSGQESIQAKEIRLLSKSLRPLPNKWTGITDKEARYRRRYLDMTMDPTVRERFKRRSLFWKYMREFLDGEGFYEVNIPVLEHTTGGADARPFVTHYDALNEDFYLRISHELPLKRLLGAGFEKVYDLGPRFRNEGFSDEHLPEHIAMEWYWAYANYRDGMKLTEDMFKFVLKKVYGTLQFQVRGFDLDLDQEWEEVDYATIIKEHFNVDIFEDEVETLAKVLAENGKISSDDIVMNRSRVVDGLWKLIRPTIAGPIFLTGVPKFLSPLSKTSSVDPRKSERFHPVIAGSELANAFSELNDPQDQLERFLDQQKLRDAGDDEAHMLDIDFVEMLEYGMPPAVGFGLSERVFWIFEGVTAREGVPFPPMRRELERTTMNIYSPLVDLTVKKSLTSSEASNKMAIIMSEEVQGWKLANSVAHISGALAARVSKSFFGRDSFLLKDRSIPSNSTHPIIVFGSKKSKLQNIINKSKDENLTVMIFTKDMIDLLTDEEVQDSLSNKNFEQLDIYGVGVYGPNDVVEQVTKGLSLYK